MTEPYLWLKALHVIAVIAWMAGLFYLPRLFVYHSRVKVGSESSELFKTMEAKLLRIIMMPAMTVAWIAGLALIWIVGDLPWWLIVKLLSVLLMTGFHVMLKTYATAFAGDQRPRSEKYFRAINEIPTVLMVVIVIMVIVKPW
jgi:putative membrane protein